MLARSCVRGLLLVCLSSLVVGCGNPSGLDSIQVTPAAQSLTVGQTTQFSVIGTFGNAKHPTTQTMTGGVTWASSNPAVASVDTSGLVTAVAAGTSTIVANATAFNGPVSSSATLTVSASSSGGGAGVGSLLSLTIIPSAITVGNLQDTGNFLAVGTFASAPFVRDLTNSVTWLSSAPDVFPVNSNNSTVNPGAPGGVVTAYGNGSATIIAKVTDAIDGSIQTATATFSCPLVLPNPPTTAGSCYPGSQAPALKATITVYNEGLNTTDWQVTAPSATGTPDVIHCGPGWTGGGGSVCVAPYPSSTFQLHIPQNPKLPANTVILRAAGGTFGGWSYTCRPSDEYGRWTDSNGNPVQIKEQEPNYCTVTFGPTGFYGPDGSPILNTNVTVGAIFNN